jgi:hypothetical protein
MKNLRAINHQDFFQLKTQYDRIKFLLQYGVLAPSTHNSQPWLFKIQGSECKVYYNPNLLIPKADPKTRDLHISIGCAIENIFQAGLYFRMNPKVDLGPFSEEYLLSIIHLSEPPHVNNQNEQKELIDSILTRINARGIFKNLNYDFSFLTDLRVKLEQDGYLNEITIHFVLEKETREKLANLTSDGLKLAYKDSNFRKEMSRWMNNSLSFKKEGLPGYALKMPILLSFIIPSLVKIKKDIGDFLAGKNYASVVSAPLITVLTSKKDDKITWLKIGRLVERLLLQFNIQKFNTSIFVASIEMADLHKTVQTILDTPEIPQFLFAVGEIDSLHKYTPRYAVEKKLIP